MPITSPACVCLVVHVIINLVTTLMLHEHWLLFVLLDNMIMMNAVMLCYIAVVLFGSMMIMTIAGCLFLVMIIT